MIDGFDAAQDAYDRMTPYDDDNYDDEDDGDFDEDDDRDFDDDFDDDFEEALQAYEDKIYNGGDV